jgi:hypothetical protein
MRLLRISYEVFLPGLYEEDEAALLAVVCGFLLEKSLAALSKASMVRAKLEGTFVLHKVLLNFILLICYGCTDFARGQRASKCSYKHSQPGVTDGSGNPRIFYVQSLCLQLAGDSKSDAIYVWERNACDSCSWMTDSKTEERRRMF